LARIELAMGVKRQDRARQARAAAERDPTHWVHVARRVVRFRDQRWQEHRDGCSKAIADDLRTTITGAGFTIAAPTTDGITLSTKGTGHDQY
jgi:hypothetical protein